MAATAELKFLMAKEEVADDIVTKLVDAGITTVKQLGVLAKDADELRAIAKDDLGIDASNLAGKVKLSHLLCAYNLHIIF